MAGTGTTRDHVWGSVTTEYDRAFIATVALYLHGQTTGLLFKRGLHPKKS